MKVSPRWFQVLWIRTLLLVSLGASLSTGFAADKRKPTGDNDAAKAVGTEYLSVGDKVRITYSDTPVIIPPTEQQIPETKKITLHLNLEVEFVGKTKTQLEKEIKDLYINKGLYKNIGIVIDVPVRTISVGGEVRSPSTYAHSAKLTLVKAINMAGGFTEYAKKTKIQVTRGDGTVVYVNWKKAVKDPKEDIAIYPGDSIQVERSIF